MNNTVQNYDLQRARDLLDQARAQCERRTEERDEARAMASRLSVEAAYGRAFLGVVAQLRRLRRTPCPTMAHGFTPLDVVQAVASELEEVCREPSGSPMAQAECVDLIAAAAHLGIAHSMRDPDLLAGMLAWSEKLQRRLDHVDAGGTWSEAKAIERAEAAE